MKKFLVTLTLALALVTSNMVYAAVIPTEVELNQNLTITYNGKVQRFKNVKGDIVYPISYEGTTYLPIRSISCLFETEIEWDGNTNSVHLGKGTLDTIAAESISKFTPGTNQNIMVDLNQDIKIYHNNEVQTFKDVNGKVVYPLSYQGTTYLPVRAISNLYNAKIEWISETSTVVISKDDKEVSDIVTENFELASKSSFNGIVTYQVYLEDEQKYLEIKAADFDLPSNLIDYHQEFLFKVTYSKKDYKVSGCALINKMTGEEIKDLSEENIKRLFDIEYGKTIVDKAWVEQIKLSELTPNAIYRYVAKETVEMPEILNDTGKDCFIYIKENKNDGWDFERYSKEVNIYNNIESDSVSFSYNEFAPNDSFNIMYKEVSTNELLTQLNESDIVRLSRYKSGEKLTYRFEDYIYNDTNNPVTLITSDSAFGVQTSEKTITIEAGRIYGFSWMIDSITVK